MVIGVGEGLTLKSMMEFSGVMAILYLDVGDSTTHEFNGQQLSNCI